MRDSAAAGGAGPYVTVLVPCAGCWGTDLPQTRCVWGVSVYSPAKLKLDQPVSSRSGQGHQVGREPVLVPRENMQVCECCMLGASSWTSW